MLKGFRRKVMQIANRLVGQGYIRACAMKTAWKLIKAHSLSTKIVGTSFDNRQNVVTHPKGQPFYEFESEHLLPPCA